MALIAADGGWNAMDLSCQALHGASEITFSRYTEREVARELKVKREGRRIRYSTGVGKQMVRSWD
jgi:hypothetical protein